MADYFISYMSNDRDWAHWIHRELERLDDKPHIHEREIRPGEDIFAWMQRRMDTVDLVPCMLVDDYLKAACCTAERNAALSEAIGSRPGLALPIAVEPLRLPIFMALASYEGRAAITALHGLPGVGKSTLVAAFAFRYGDILRAMWWIKAAAYLRVRPRDQREGSRSRPPRPATRLNQRSR